MRQLNTWPRALLKLPLVMRLAIVGGTIIFSLFLYVISFSTVHNGYILTIPAVLATWIFKKKGLFIFLAITFCTLGIYQVIHYHGLFWPVPFALSSIGGFILIAVLGYLIVVLRDLLDASEDARLRAEEAERQTAIAYEQQRQLNELKNQFILNVNHELRSPITVISGYLSLLLDKHDYIDREAQERYLKSAMRSCKELQVLTNDVLDTMMLSDNKEFLNIEDIPVAPLAREVVEQFQSTWDRSRRTYLDIAEQITVRGNIQCFRHVLRNLLSNAYKYSSPDKPVTISATTNPAPQPEVCISIKDEGSGIPPDQIPLLFGQFVRLQRDLAGSIRGSGLGLFISKNLVEAMKGHIWVESTGIAGEGSCFYFTLPDAIRSRL